MQLLLYIAMIKTKTPFVTTSAKSQSRNYNYMHGKHIEILWLTKCRHMHACMHACTKCIAMFFLKKLTTA